MGGNLPWNLVFTGVFIAIVVEDPVSPCSPSPSACTCPSTCPSP